MNTDMSLERFVNSQKSNYQIALNEVKQGCKESHWMWYIFPQITGLGHSSISICYAIRDIEEAKAYMENEYLSANLLEISRVLLDGECHNAKEIFGNIDAKKLKSSMTLFAVACPECDVFQAVLDKFFNGKRDKLTLKILEKQ